MKTQLEFKNLTEEQLLELFRFLEINNFQFEVMKSDNEYNLDKE